MGSGMGADTRPERLPTAKPHSLSSSSVAEPVQGGRPLDHNGDSVVVSSAAPPFGIIGIGNGFVAFDKPAGLHSAHIAGGSAVSLEGLLPHWWARLWQAYHSGTGVRGSAPDSSPCANPDSGAEAGPELSSAVPPLPQLLTRLDRETSGIVLAALPGQCSGNANGEPCSCDGIASAQPSACGGTADVKRNAYSGTAGIESGPGGNSAAAIDVLYPAATYFRTWERQGRACKEYFALVRGELVSVLTLDQRLDTANRSVTKVFGDVEPEYTRHTRVEPLVVLRGTELLEKGILLPEYGECLPDGSACAPGHGADATLGNGSGQEDEPDLFTLVRVTILRGARHQIRAHLAHAGFPILGDPLYGKQAGTPCVVRMYLHHARVTLPGFTASVMPGWGVGEYLYSILRLR